MRHEAPRGIPGAAARLPGNYAHATLDTHQRQLLGHPGRDHHRQRQRHHPAPIAQHLRYQVKGKRILYARAATTDELIGVVSDWLDRPQAGLPDP